MAKISKTQWAGFIKLVPALYAAITGLVEELEHSSSYSGEQKKSSVLSVLALLMETGELLVGLDIPSDAVLSIAGRLIDLVVEIKNNVGEFTHKATAAA